MFFELQKRQVLTIRNPQNAMKPHQTADIHQLESGAPSQKWMTAARQPAPAGIGIPTKYFRPGRPGFIGCGLSWMLNRASLAAPATRNRNEHNVPIWRKRARSSGLL